MTPGDDHLARPGAFEPDYSDPHVKSNYPSCTSTERRRRPLPPPSVPPLGDTSPPWADSESR
jgi:hypothetical protein